MIASWRVKKVYLKQNMEWCPQSRSGFKLDQRKRPLMRADEKITKGDDEKKISEAEKKEDEMDVKKKSRRSSYEER